MLCRLLLTFLLLACLRSASAQHGGRYLDPSAPVNWQSPLNRGLMSWWLALPDQQRGVIFRDICRRNHGTLTNMDPPTDWVGARGRPGGFGALDFDGSNDQVNLSAISMAGALSAFGWMNVRSYTSPKPGLIANGGGNDQHLVLVFNSASSVQFRVAAGTSVNTTIPAQTAGVWTHYGIVRDSSNLITYYINGVAVASTSATGTSGTISPSAIGRSFSTPTSGAIDDVRLYNSRALSAAEVWQLYQDSRRGYPATLAWQGGSYNAPEDAPPPATNGNFLPLLSLAPDRTWEGVDHNPRHSPFAILGAIAP